MLIRLQGRANLLLIYYWMGNWTHFKAWALARRWALTAGGTD